MVTQSPEGGQHAAATELGSVGWRVDFLTMKPQRTQVSAKPKFNPKCRPQLDTTIRHPQCLKYVPILVGCWYFLRSTTQSGSSAVNSIEDGCLALRFDVAIGSVWNQDGSVPKV